MTDTEFKKSDEPYEAAAIVSRTNGTHITTFDVCHPRDQPLSGSQLEAYRSSLRAYAKQHPGALVASWGTPELQHMRAAGLSQGCDLIMGFQALYPDARPSSERPFSFGMDFLRRVLGMSADGAHHALQDCYDTSTVVLTLLRATIAYCEEHDVAL